MGVSIRRQMGFVRVGVDDAMTTVTKLGRGRRAS